MKKAHPQVSGRAEFIANSSEHRRHVGTYQSAINENPRGSCIHGDDIGSLAGTRFIEDLTGKRRAAGTKMIYSNERILFAEGSQELVHICAHAVEKDCAFFPGLNF